MRLFLFSIIIMVFPVFLAFPQNTFQLIYGGGGEENANDIKQTYDGGYILTGKTNSAGAGQDDLFLLKTDSAGSVEWAKTYGGPGIEEGKEVLQTPDSGVIIFPNYAIY